MEFSKESLMNEYIFEAACEQLDPEGMGIMLDRTGKTIEAHVLDYFFDKHGEDAYTLKPKFLEEYTENLLENDSQPSDALYETIMYHADDLSYELSSQYKYGYFTEDPDELDEQIDEYLLEKRMEED